jgi:FkbM family methyltransferase
MSLIEKPILRPLVRGLAIRVERIGSGSVLVQRSPGAYRVVRVDGRPPDAGLVLLRNARRAYRARLQRHLGAYLAREQIAWVLHATAANCVLDVGANVGQFARSLRADGYRGRIVSFEPVARAFMRLQEAAADDPAWDVYPYALGRESGTAEIHADPRTLSSLLPPSDFGRQRQERLSHQVTELIEVRRLEDVFEEVTAGLDAPRPYLKMDTQGFDLEVFAGAGRVLEHVVGMQSEVSCVPLYDGMPRLPEQLATYEAAGFETAGMYQVSRERATLRVIEFDLVMVRPSAVRRRKGG